MKTLISKAKRNIFFLLILSGSSHLAVANTPDCTNLVGDWVNELNGELRVKSVDEKTGLIQASYFFPLEPSGRAFEVVGWRSYKAPEPPGDNVVIVSFSVSWGNHGAITAWTGTCRADKNGLPTIKTLSHLARSNTRVSWDHIAADASIFVPLPVGAKK